MRHIIIGLSPESTDCLLRTEQLCSRLPDNAQPVLFYVGCSDFNHQNKNIQSIVFTPEMFQAALNQSAQNTADLTQAELSEYIQNEMYKHRRVYAECLQQNLSIFQNKIKELCSNDCIFYLIVNLASAESSGMLTVMINALNDCGAEKIKIALLLPTGDLSEIHSAQVYASLLECQAIMSQKAVMNLFNFDGSKASFNRAITDVAYRLFSNITAGSFQYPLPISDEPNFWKTEEIALFSDTPQMIEMLSKQSIYGIVDRMFYGENPKDKQEEPIMWLEDLFTDKRWLMHEDYLLKDEEIIVRNTQSNKKGKSAPVPQEWASRSKFFLEKTQSLDWKARIDSIAQSLNDVAQQHFRGRGINVHYAISEALLSETATVIVDQLQQAVIEEWRATRCSLNIFIQWFQDIINIIEPRLKEWKDRQKQHAENAENALMEYMNLIKKWETASGGGKKDIQKQYPAEKVANIVEQHYVEDCFAKGSQYGYRLLGAVIDTLGNIIHYLKKHIKEKQEDMKNALPNTQQMSVKNAVSTHHTTEYHISLEANLASAMPPVFQKSETALYPKLRAMFIDNIDAQKGMEGVVEIFNDKKINEQVAKYIAKNHPFLLNHQTETAHLLFWRTMASLTEQCSVADTLKKWQEKHNADALSVHSWQIPVCPFGQPVSNRISEICNKMAENSIVQTDLDIQPQHLHYRYSESVPFDQIEKIEQIATQYEETLLTENGAALSYLLHSQAPMLYPEFSSNNAIKIKPDDIRQQLIQGEIFGVLQEDENGVYMQISGTNIPLGTEYCDIPNNIGSFKYRMLSTAIENAKQNVQVDNEATVALLNERLEKIKLYCLNGKTDLRKATWTEAGNYMPWGRQVDKALRKLNQ